MTKKYILGALIVGAAAYGILWWLGVAEASRETKADGSEGTARPEKSVQGKQRKTTKPMQVVNATAGNPPVVPVAAMDCAVSERFVRVNGSRMRVLEAGRASEQPVVLFHGATFRAELFVALGTVEFLCRGGYFAVSADLPGHGKSVRPDMPREGFVYALLQALAVDHPVVVGHSFAGQYLLPMLVHHSEQLAGAVLMGVTGVSQYERALSRVSEDAMPPVLVLWGGADELVPPSRAARLQKAVIGSQIEIFSGARHEFYDQQPARFHEALNNFLVGIDAP